MATKTIVTALKEKFGERPDVVSFLGKTEKVGDDLRVYIGHGLTTYFEFPARERHHVAKVDGTTERVWVARTQKLAVTAHGPSAGADWLEGPISDIRFTADVRAGEFEQLPLDWISACGTKTKSSMRCDGLPPELRGDPGPGDVGGRPAFGPRR